MLNSVDDILHRAWQRTAFVLTPDATSTWLDVPNTPFWLPSNKSRQPHYLWHDATQSGYADNQELLSLALTPTNRMTVLRYDPKDRSCQTYAPDFTYEIMVVPANNTLSLTVSRGSHELITQEAEINNPDPLYDFDLFTFSGCPQIAHVLATVRSIARAHRAGKLQSWHIRSITVGATDDPAYA